MKKALMIVVMAVVFGVSLSAQTDVLQPGIYTVNGGVPVPLKYEQTATETSEVWAGGEIDLLYYREYFLRKTTAETLSEGTFVLVINPDKKVIVKTLTKYDPFVKTVNPENMMLVPLQVRKKKRVYVNEEFNLLKGAELYWTHIDYSWEQTGDNTYLIKADLAPGEYAFAFRINKLAPWDMATLYTFRVE